MDQEEQKKSFPAREEEILKFWEENKIFEKSLAKNKKGKTFVFYEGPPTANGMPGIHHVEARSFKDIILRYKTMAGFFVPRRAGWDTHGLPVEIQVEKKLGLKNKQEIENYGVAKFNAEAKKSVWEYKEEWEKLTKRMGFWIDLAHPYITYETSYIETLWWIIKEFWKKGLLYEDFKVVPWCPRCQTALSSHEVGLGYKEVEDTAVYVKFKVKPGQKIASFGVDTNTYILSWTTTPWTLPGNVALAVGKDIEYVLAQKEGESFVVAASRLAAVAPDARVVKTIWAKDLVGLLYEPLFSVGELQSDTSHRVYAAPFVSAAEGTGVVHTAVMYGEDDYRLGSEVGLPKFHTVTEDGKFISGLKDLGGLAVKDRATEERILKILADKNLLFSKEKYRHEYPYCWRCDTPLLYYARKAWWVKTTAVKKQLLANNEKINWIPEHIKRGRFGEFLRDLRDWAFSRERYWGTPLPIWKCDKCGHIEVVGSCDELKKLARTLPHDEKGEVDLHRPYVDEIWFDCKKCKGKMKRIPEVADVWFDSGAMPFASQTPNAKRQKVLYPADYIVEAVDQTRGWFYTLLAVATLLGKKAPYKNVISLGHVLDKNGQKMSKSKGNIVNPQEMMQKYGVDALRWYFFTINAPGEPKRFDEKDVQLRQRGFISTLWNSFVFFDTYVEKVNSANLKAAKSKDFLDIWVRAKLNLLVGEMTRDLEMYDVVGAARALEDFVIKDYSQWFIKHSRRRLQHPETSVQKDQAAIVLGATLAQIARLAAPFTPFLSESIWIGLGKKMRLSEESVHFVKWPVAGKKISAAIIRSMAMAQKISTELLRARAEAGIQLRQPLQSVQTKGRVTPEFAELLKKIINVKEVIYGNEWRIDTRITAELREEGIAREMIRAVQEMRRELGLRSGQAISCGISGVEAIEQIIQKRAGEIRQGTNSREVKIGGKGKFRIEREVVFEEGKVEIGIY